MGNAFHTQQVPTGDPRDAWTQLASWRAVCWPRVVLRLVICQAEKKPSKIGSWGKESEIEIIFMNNLVVI